MKNCLTRLFCTAAHSTLVHVVVGAAVGAATLSLAEMASGRAMWKGLIVGGVSGAVTGGYSAHTGPGCHTLIGDAFAPMVLGCAGADVTFGIIKALHGRVPTSEEVILLALPPAIVAVASKALLKLVPHP